MELSSRFPSLQLLTDKSALYQRCWSSSEVLLGNIVRIPMSQSREFIFQPQTHTSKAKQQQSVYEFTPKFQGFFMCAVGLCQWLIWIERYSLGASIPLAPNYSCPDSAFCLLAWQTFSLWCCLHPSHTRGVWETICCTSGPHLDTLFFLYLHCLLRVAVPIMGNYDTRAYLRKIY